MDSSTSIFLLYVFIMMIVAFMIRSLLPSPHYYAILLMVGIMVFIVIYPIPNIYSAAEYSIIQRPMYDPLLEKQSMLFRFQRNMDRIDDLEWENEKAPEPKMPVAPKPIVIPVTH